MKIKFLTIFVLLIISSLQVLAYDPNYKDYTIKNQWYQATFDESGAATVYVALNIFNKGFNNQSLDVIKVEIPRGSVEVLEVVQAVGGDKRCNQVCTDYQQICTGGTEVICNNFDKNTNQCASWQERCKAYTSQCMRYEEQCYNDPYYSDYDYNKDFKLLDKNQIVKNGNILEIPIEKIPSGASTKVLLKYKYVGGVNQGFYNSFVFETLKVPVISENVRVSIVTDKNLVIAGTKTERTFGGFGMLSAEKMSVAEDVRSIDIKNPSDYQRLFSALQYSRGLVEERTNLDAGNSIIVKGKYSENRFKLYIFEILFTLVLFIALMYGMYRYTQNINETTQAQQLKAMKEFHIWRAIGFSFLSFALFFAFLIGSLFSKAGYFKALILALAFFSLIGTLFYVGRAHSAKEVLTAIGFFFAWIVAVPFLFFVIAIIIQLFTYRVYY